MPIEAYLLISHNCETDQTFHDVVAANSAAQAWEKIQDTRQREHVLTRVIQSFDQSQVEALLQKMKDAAQVQEGIRIYYAYTYRVSDMDTAEVVLSGKDLVLAASLKQARQLGWASVCEKIPASVNDLIVSITQIDAAGPDDLPEYISDTRIFATFQPEAWQRDNAVEIDGRIQFDITDQVLGMGREKALLIEDNDYPGDELWQQHPASELHGHCGPFQVLCEDAIRDYYFNLDAAAQRAAQISKEKTV